MYQGSALFPIFCRAASTVIPLLPKATSHHPSSLTSAYLVPPSSYSAINTLLAIRYSSILSTCPNLLNTLWSALLASSHSSPALQRTSSFQTLSIRPTKLLKHFNSRTLIFLLSALLIPHASAPYNAVGTIAHSYWHFLAFIPNPLPYSAHISALPTLFTLYTSTSLSHPPSAANYDPM